MPSGYTSAIYEGKEEVTLRDFILTCARGMGALVTMRDEPFDAPIPDEFKPHTSYHDEAIEKATDLLQRLDTADRMDLVQEKNDEYNANLQRWWEAKKESDALLARYKKMMDEVLEWEPPSEDHQGLKQLMIDQLSQSIEHDCRYSKFDTPEDDPYRPRFGPMSMSIDDWIAEKRKSALRDIEYYTKAREEEVERTRSRNRWIRQLKNALPPKEKEPVGA